jgi:sterol 3beta-glucosyltransferase
VSALGVGPKPIPYRRLTAERLAIGLRQLIADEGIRAAGTALGQRIRAAGTALGQRIRAERGQQRAVRLIDDYLRPTGRTA